MADKTRNGRLERRHDFGNFVRRHIRFRRRISKLEQRGRKTWGEQGRSFSKFGAAICSPFCRPLYRGNRDDFPTRRGPFCPIRRVSRFKKKKRCAVTKRFETYLKIIFLVPTKSFALRR